MMATVQWKSMQLIILCLLPLSLSLLLSALSSLMYMSEAGSSQFLAEKELAPEGWCLITGIHDLFRLLVFNFPRRMFQYLGVLLKDSRHLD